MNSSTALFLIVLVYLFAVALSAKGDEDQVESLEAKIESLHLEIEKSEREIAMLKDMAKGEYPNFCPGAPLKAKN